MPDAGVPSGVSRRRRLPALVTGVTLVGTAAVVCSTVERLHSQACEVRRLRAQLAERWREINRQRQEMAAVVTTIDGLVPSARALGGQAREVCQAGEPRARSAALPQRVGIATSGIDDGTVPEHAIATLAWVEEQIADAGDAFVVQSARAARRAREARSVPTLWPVQGAVSSPFGWRRSPYGGGWEWHPGIDITAAFGTPVRATADGEVVAAGRDRGYGVLVVVDHGATTTRYAHLSATWVHAGETVLQGEPLGALGGTGRATAPHLHYEVRFGNAPLDPQCFLSDPAGATFDDGERRSYVCAVARARVEDRRSPATARDATHATTPRAGVAG